MLRKSFIPAVALVVSIAAARPALAISNESIRIKVPFAFHVLDTTLPAGSYIVQRTASFDPSVLLIRRTDGRGSAFLLTQTTTVGEKVKKAELVFDRYGDERFLHAILVPEEGGDQVPRSRVERLEAVANVRHPSRAPEPSSGM